MVSKVAVEEFLARSLRDLHEYKRKPEYEIDAELAEYDPPPRFYTQPRLNQKVAFLLALKNPLPILFDMGLGKTWVGLNLLRYLKRCKVVQRGIVFVPNAVNVQSWLREAAKHAPQLRVVGMTGDREQREEVLDSEFDLLICTYIGWMVMACEKGKVQKRGSKKKKIGLKPGKKLEKLAARFQFVCYDEPTVYLQNEGSTAFRVFRRFLKYAPYRYSLTGTPFGRDPAALWAQFYLVDKGETLGDTLGLYRGAFFREKLNAWTGYPEYEFDERKKKQLMRQLRHGSIRYSEAECLDLPESVDISKPVIWPAETWTYYVRLLNKIRDEKHDVGRRENLYIRMRQLCSGYLKTKDAKGGDVEIVFAENPKLEVLEQMVEELPAGRKMVVFHIYKRTGLLICERLKALRVPHVWIYSGTKPAVRDTLEERVNDPADALRVVVASEAAGYGLNLQGANWVWFFESPSDPKMRKQMEKRVDRQGQTRRTFIVDCYVKNSIESKILRGLREGYDLHDAVVDGRITTLL